MLAEDKKLIQNKELQEIEREIFRFVSLEIREILAKIDYKKLECLEEIRLRADKPLILRDACGDWFPDESGHLYKDDIKAYRVTQNQIIKTLELMSENSIYAYQDEIKNGFITLKGGHRVGITGKTVMEGLYVKNIRDISGLNIRVSREVLGCSSKVIRYLIRNSSDIYNTLIISPPQCGKTTMLRDISRFLGDGDKQHGFKGVKVGIVDERSELAACYKGVAQKRVGLRTDVLDGCPKVVGMIMMLRSMSPDVIITDEIGNIGDKDAIMQVVNAGVRVITTAHGYSISDLKTRREVLSLIEEKVFDRYIVLNNKDGPGTIGEIIDGNTMKALEEGCHVI